MPPLDLALFPVGRQEPALDGLRDRLQGALDQAFSAKRPVVMDVKSHVDGIAPRAWLPQ